MKKVNNLKKKMKAICSQFNFANLGVLIDFPQIA